MSPPTSALSWGCYCGLPGVASDFPGNAGNVSGRFVRRAAIHLSGEATVAVGALEGSLLSVRPHVDFQAACAAKHLKCKCQDDEG